jgi:two-component system CheB/CheR fusion protein
MFFCWRFAWVSESLGQMKKSKPGKKKAIRANSRKTFRPVSRTRGATPGSVGDAVNVVSRAREVLNKSTEARRKADDLHKSIEKMHVKAASRRERVDGKTLDLIPDSHLLKEEDQTEKTAPGKPFPIVGLGASAGGFEAFSEFLKILPTDTGMAFVLVQHLDPNHKSQLTELLGRSANLPVVEAKDGIEVSPNHVYVIPANAGITITHGRLRLSPRKQNESPPMPVDAFFRSLANEQQDRAIGIVLSGTGTDGTLGIEAIKGEGGITFAQHESSAKYYGMPGSAFSSGSVDFMLTPEGIAAELRRIAQHPYLEPARKAPDRIAAQEIKSDQMLKGSEKEMGQLFSLLRARTGVDFALYKHSTLKRRIVRQMILQKLDSLGKYISFLEKQPREVDNLFNDLLIYVTSFFRDPRAFQTLKKTVFPRLMKAHADDSPLRFWVCGCSTGEEAFSLAISLVEFFEENRTHRQVQIFASDISDIGINKARAGMYPQNIVQDVSAERLRRFFSKTDGHYQVNKSIRDMVIFARQNVIVDPPFSNLDMITCRNVLIYLDGLLQRKIMPVFHYALRPHGFLMLGNSETVGPAGDLFSLMNKKHKIYAKKHAYTRPAFPTHKPDREAGSPDQRASHPSPPEARQPDLQTQMDKLLLRDFAPAAVLVSSDFEVLHFRGRTAEYLEHSPGAASLNLLRMARESLVIDLRAALTKAGKNDTYVRHTTQIRRDNHVSEIVIEITPFRPTPDSERFFLIIFRESGATPYEPSRVGKGHASLQAREITKLRAELATTRESLQTIIEEQEANNEELKSANEEIQSSNEELQSTNEELETAKGELQSTNEELTTLNEELHTRNTELGQAINDLTNLLASINVAILMLSEDLNIRRYTPMAERLFSLIPSDLGRRFTDLNRSILIPDLQETISSVIANLTPIERDVQDRDGHWYSLRIRPYRTRENRIEGVVILLVDIDHLKRALDAVLTTAKEPLLTIGADLKVRSANDSFYRTFHMSPDETVGRFLYEAGNGQWNTLELRELLEEVLPKSKLIHDYPLEASFPDIGKRKLLINAFRFYDEGWGLQTILMAIEDVTGNKG